MRLATVREVADLLQLSERNVREQIADGTIPALRVSVRAIRVDLEELRRGLPHVVEVEMREPPGS